MMRPDPETVFATLAGAALGGWALGGRRGGRQGALIGGVVGGLNGAIGGRRRIYDWAEPEGAAGFVLDSTWALTNTAAALAVHALSHALADPDYRTELSERKNRHVYGRGFSIRGTFAFTQGNVITNAAGSADLDRPDDSRTVRRRLLIDRHEDLHVWQGRWFGPIYPVVYVGWMAFGAVRGVARSARRRDHTLWEHVEVAAYYENPFERWAYGADDRWPPEPVNRLHSRSPA